MPGGAPSRPTSRDRGTERFAYVCRPVSLQTPYVSPSPARFARALPITPVKNRTWKAVTTQNPAAMACHSPAQALHFGSVSAPMLAMRLIVAGLAYSCRMSCRPSNETARPATERTPAASVSARQCWWFFMTWIADALASQFLAVAAPTVAERELNRQTPLQSATISLPGFPQAVGTPAEPKRREIPQPI